MSANGHVWMSAECIHHDCDDCTGRCARCPAPCMCPCHDPPRDPPRP